MGTKEVPASFEGLILWDDRFGSSNLGDGDAILMGAEPDEPIALNASHGSLEASGSADGVISVDLAVLPTRVQMLAALRYRVAGLTWALAA